MKLKFLLLTFLFLILSSRFSFAENKTFSLKDGSTVKGTLISFQSGMFTIQTENLGQLQIKEEDVLSVNAAGVVPAAAQPLSAGSNPLGAMAGMGGSGGMSPMLQQQVNNVQGQIMANPELFSMIEQMAQDPELVQIISDPAFMQQMMQAVSTNDTERLKNDPKIQKIMSNPSMQKLIEQMGTNPQ